MPKKSNKGKEKESQKEKKLKNQKEDYLSLITKIYNNSRAKASILKNNKACKEAVKAKLAQNKSINISNQLYKDIIAYLNKAEKALQLANNNKAKDN